MKISTSDESCRRNGLTEWGKSVEIGSQTKLGGLETHGCASEPVCHNVLRENRVPSCEVSKADP